MNIVEKFSKLGIDNAPGQESLKKDRKVDLRGEKTDKQPVDFSHGDIDAHMPIPGSKAIMMDAIDEGGKQAYTPYRGKKAVLEDVAEKLSKYTGKSINPGNELILTPGTQGALFLAMGANIMPGDKVAIVEPDYFANRKMVQFFGGEMVEVQMNWKDAASGSGIDMESLEKYFKEGVSLFLFSNPNNPTGKIYSEKEILEIASLSKKYNVTLIVDELYSRQVFDGTEFTHLCGQKEVPDNLVTIIGPSKTESMSGYRLGAAFGNKEIISRMEKLQAIMALRCPGYNQKVFKCWFNEPEGWMQDRIDQHQKIRDDILKVIAGVEGVSAVKPDGGSYLFIEIPELEVSLHDFITAVRELEAVTLTPGTEFGPQFTHHFRINFSQDHDRAVDAMERVFRLMELYRIK